MGKLRFCIKMRALRHEVEYPGFQFRGINVTRYYLARLSCRTCCPIPLRYSAWLFWGGVYINPFVPLRWAHGIKGCMAAAPRRARNGPWCLWAEFPLLPIQQEMPGVSKCCRHCRVRLRRVQLMHSIDCVVYDFASDISQPVPNGGFRKLTRGMRNIRGGGAWGPKSLSGIQR